MRTSIPVYFNWIVLIVMAPFAFTPYDGRIITYVGGIMDLTTIALLMKVLYFPTVSMFSKFIITDTYAEEYRFRKLIKRKSYIDTNYIYRYKRALQPVCIILSDVPLNRSVMKQAKKRPDVIVFLLTYSARKLIPMDLDKVASL